MGTDLICRAMKEAIVTMLCLALIGAVFSSLDAPLLAADLEAINVELSLPFPILKVETLDNERRYLTNCLDDAMWKTCTSAKDCTMDSGKDPCGCDMVCDTTPDAKYYTSPTASGCIASGGCCVGGYSMQVKNFTVQIGGTPFPEGWAGGDCYEKMKAKLQVMEGENFAIDPQLADTAPPPPPQQAPPQQQTD